MIEISDLYVSYKWRQEPIIRGISAKFNDKHLVLGPNGSGKTTLFRAIAGLTPISSGKILIDGVNVADIYGKPGILSLNLREIFSVFHLSAYDHIRFFIDLMNGEIDLAFNILEELGVERELLRRRKPWELSAGQFKAYTTAIALASKAKHILLDEPFEQLDPARKSKLIRYLNETKSIILLNTHETWLLNILKPWKVAFMFEGRLYGMLPASELLDARLISGKRDDAILSFEVSNRTYSIVKGEAGESLTKLTTLDKVYELVLGE